jgi:hypothetical protein
MRWQKGYAIQGKPDLLVDTCTVIGVGKEGCLWFHCDCDPGASFWDNGKSYQDLRLIGISPIEVMPVCIGLF